jgi:hypothetical protein
VPSESQENKWFKLNTKFIDVLNGPTEIIDYELDSELNIDYHTTRLATVVHIHKLLALPFDSKLRHHNEFLAKIKNTVEKYSNKHINSLHQDLVGQITESISRSEWFNKWGRHYLPALALSHKNEICSNFKDPGIQHYGGVLCKAERDKSEKIFIEMPPPIPSNPYTRPRGAVATAAPRTTMDSYMNRGGGCFQGDCPVKLESNVLAKISELKKGDLVKAGEKFYPVKCLIKMSFPNNQPMVKLGNSKKLIITPYHPVLKDDVWTFPYDIGTTRPYENTTFLYNIVLEKPGTFITVDGIDCCTLGHGLTDNHVIKHDFWGDRVIQSLSNKNGWKEGFVTIKCDCIVRDSITHNVSNFK